MERRAHDTGIWIFSGRGFSAGALAALRAYPAVIAAQHLALDSHEYLLLEVGQQADDTTVFIETIHLAGGEVESARWMAASMQAALSMLREGRAASDDDS